MNIRRGLFRLWFVVSGMWVAAVAAFFWYEIADPYLLSVDYYYNQESDTFQPLPEELLFYKAKDIYKTFELKKDGREIGRVVMARELTSGQALAVTTRFSQLIEDGRGSRVSERRLGNLRMAAATASVPPAIFLAIGGAFFWALSGFARPSGPTP